MVFVNEFMTLHGRSVGDCVWTFRWLYGLWKFYWNCILGCSTKIVTSTVIVKDYFIVLNVFAIPFPRKEKEKRRTRSKAVIIKWLLCCWMLMSYHDLVFVIIIDQRQRIHRIHWHNLQGLAINSIRNRLFCFTIIANILATRQDL